MIFSFTVFSAIIKIGRLVLNALWAYTVESKNAALRVSTVIFVGQNFIFYVKKIL